MIEYTSGDRSLLDRIAPLWEKTRAYHVACSTHFAADMAGWSFVERMKELPAVVHVDMASDDKDMRCVGYCLSSINPERNGRVESLYVEDEYRGRGIGEALMRKALAWLREQEAQSTIIAVAAGNEEVIGFYARFGFYPKTVLLGQPKVLPLRT